MENSLKYIHLFKKYYKSAVFEILDTKSELEYS